MLRRMQMLVSSCSCSSLSFLSLLNRSTLPFIFFSTNVAFQTLISSLWKTKIRFKKWILGSLVIIPNRYVQIETMSLRVKDKNLCWV
ncbi:hypothetical protein Bca52824_060900 [Brassica carinata]|uniref:Uncharacterized protein n=1 Tax=Brassica carinata TaxID=52824 RepID=A0A8X7QXG7_BRACI|nr:hypothetical protein Bca52824_060900 [Brassica carinata]